MAERGLNDLQFNINPYLIPLSFDQQSYPFWLQMWQQTAPNLQLDTEQATGLSSLLGGGGIVKKDAATTPTTPTTANPKTPIVTTGPGGTPISVTPAPGVTKPPPKTPPEVTRPTRPPTTPTGATPSAPPLPNPYNLPANDPLIAIMADYIAKHPDATLPTR